MIGVCRERSRLADERRRLEPVHAGHLHVEEDHGEVLRDRCFNAATPDAAPDVPPADAGEDRLQRPGGSPGGRRPSGCRARRARHRRGPRRRFAPWGRPRRNARRVVVVFMTGRAPRRACAPRPRGGRGTRVGPCRPAWRCSPTLGFDALLAVPLHRLRRQRDDRRRRVARQPADAAHRLVPVDARHHHVHQDHVDVRVGRQLLDAVGAVVGVRHRHPEPLLEPPSGQRRSARRRRRSAPSARAAPGR